LTPGIYFHFNIDQGMQKVGLEQWDRLDEVRAHTREHLQMAEVDLRLEAVVAAMGGRRRPVVMED